MAQGELLVKHFSLSGFVKATQLQEQPSHPRHRKAGPRQRAGGEMPTIQAGAPLKVTGPPTPTLYKYTSKGTRLLSLKLAKKLNEPDFINTRGRYICNR